MLINLLVVAVMALGLIVPNEQSIWIDCVAYTLMAIGVLFFFGATIGILRFPDYYTRLHAAGKGDTLSTMLILVGAAMYALNHEPVSVATILIGAKIMFIVNFIFIGSPTATHAMMDAGYETELEHWSKPK